jgi:hypothetical protein
LDRGLKEIARLAYDYTRVSRILQVSPAKRAKRRSVAGYHFPVDSEKKATFGDFQFIIVVD